jgi:TPP-dependent pyruvate/acetoin dehydrogenase alpha subunit
MPRRDTANPAGLISKAEGPVPSAETLIDLYGRMSLIRQFEERLKWLVETGVPVGAALLHRPGGGRLRHLRGDRAR